MTDLYVVKTDEPKMGKGVFVTEDWDEAVEDIKAKIQMGRVTVEKAKSHE